MVLCMFSEPGYYEKGQFGIRIEDIVQIVPAASEHDFNGRGAFTFKTVTMCPIHTKLINKSLLTETEVHTNSCRALFKLIIRTQFELLICNSFLFMQRAHLNDYHATVRETLKPLLQQEGDQLTIQWLEQKTQAI